MQYPGEASFPSRSWQIWDWRCLHSGQRYDLRLRESDLLSVWSSWAFSVPVDMGMSRLLKAQAESPWKNSPQSLILWSPMKASRDPLHADGGVCLEIPLMCGEFPARLHWSPLDIFFLLYFNKRLHFTWFSVPRGFWMIIGQHVEKNEGAENIWMSVWKKWTLMLISCKIQS